MHVVQGRVHHMTVKEDPSRRGVSEEKWGVAVAMATPPLSPDFQRGRKNFKSQPSALERLLLKGTHRAAAAEHERAELGAPALGRRPRRPSPPRSGPTLDPSPASAQGLLRSLSPEPGRVRPPARPTAAEGVCAPGGARTCPPSSRRLPPAGSPPPGCRPASSLLTGLTVSGEGRRRAWGERKQAASSGAQQAGPN